MVSSMGLIPFASLSIYIFARLILQCPNRYMLRRHRSLDQIWSLERTTVPCYRAPHDEYIADRWANHPRRPYWASQKTDSRKMIVFIPIYEKCSAAWQSIRLFATTLPRPISTPDSVVCNNSTFSRRKQENDKFTRFLIFGACERIGTSVIGREAAFSLTIALQKTDTPTSQKWLA